MTEFLNGQLQVLNIMSFIFLAAVSVTAGVIMTRWLMKRWL